MECKARDAHKPQQPLGPEDLGKELGAAIRFLVGPSNRIYIKFDVRVVLALGRKSLHFLKQRRLVF